MKLGRYLQSCLLYTSDAADERSSVDLGGRRIINKKKSRNLTALAQIQHKHENNHIMKNDICDT